MTLRELMGAGADVEILSLAHDTRDVRPGTLFFCVPGLTRDGHDLAGEAIERGAVALVVERPPGLGGGGRWGSSASGRSAWGWRRWWSSRCARRWRPRPRASTAIPPRSSPSSA